MSFIQGAIEHLESCSVAMVSSSDLTQYSRNPFFLCCVNGIVEVPRGYLVINVLASIINRDPGDAYFGLDYSGVGTKLKQSADSICETEPKVASSDRSGTGECRGSSGIC